jgi:hypothetical protein
MGGGEIATPAAAVAAEDGCLPPAAAPVGFAAGTGAGMMAGAAAAAAAAAATPEDEDEDDDEGNGMGFVVGTFIGRMSVAVAGLAHAIRSSQKPKWKQCFSECRQHGNDVAGAWSCHVKGKDYPTIALSTFIITGTFDVCWNN